jgi:hypothetical protein
MKSSGHSYFAQRDFYANAMFVRAQVLDGHVTLHIAAAPFQPFKTAGRISGDVTLKRADVQKVYRCGRNGLVMFSDTSGVPPTMVSWWVAQELLAGTGVIPTQAGSQWCREQVRNA